MDILTNIIKRIVRDELRLTHDEITLQSRFIDDLGADSLDTVELTMRFEEEFNIEISDEDAEKILTVGDLVNYITRVLKT